MDKFKHKKDLRMDYMHSRPGGARPYLGSSKSDTNASIRSNGSRPTPFYRQDSNRTMSKSDYPSASLPNLYSDFIAAQALFLM